MRQEVFKGLGRELGGSIHTDEVGNTYVANTDEMGVYAESVHLDSMTAAADGVMGVIAGLMSDEVGEGGRSRIPLQVSAFRCSRAISAAVIGSGLITKEVYKRDIGQPTAKNGRLWSRSASRGADLHPETDLGVGRYLELHIRQGKVLEEYQTESGIVGTVRTIRYRVYLRGMAEHSGDADGRGVTRCVRRQRRLSGVRKIGKQESAYQSVATVGVIQNYPNVLNVIPGH